MMPFKYLLWLVFILPILTFYSNFFALRAQHALLPEQQFYDVHFYNIELSVDVSAESVAGIAGISGEISENGTQQISLNFFDNMVVDSIKSQGQTLTYNHDNNYLTINLPQPLNSGDLFSISVFYHGNPVTAPPYSSGLNFATQNSQPLVYSYHWPYFAHTYIPCKDHPSDKADSMRIAVTVPDIYEVASNGILTATNIIPGNKKQFIWKTHYPMGIYHLSINIHPFDVFHSNYNSPISGNIALEFYLFPNHSPTAHPQLETMVPKIHEAFEDRYGAFPFASEKYGICESVINGGMEHQTILTMNYPAFFSNIVVHESAHEYFGNMISIADWGHIWLSEGFATYSEAIYREYWEGPSGYQHEISQQMAGAGGGSIFVSDPSDPQNIIPYSLVYLKASTVLHMLRFVMGDTLFFQMLHDYVTTSPYRFQNIDTEQFRNFGESYYGSDLNWFFDQWIYGDGKMAADYHHYWHSGGDSLIFKIHSIPSFPGSSTYHAMPIPIEFRTAGDQFTDTLWVDSLNLSKKYAFADSANLNIRIDPDNKILKGPFNYVDRPNLTSAYLQQNAIQVEWEPFFDFTNYEVYIYREQSPGNFVLIGTVPVAGYQYSFTPVQNATYGLSVVGIQNGHATGMSDLITVNYTTFPMDQGLLVVDETLNGNGAHMLNPTDQAVDSFYNSLLANHPTQQFDVIREGRAPHVFDFAPYELILWHHEVLYPTVIDQSQSELQAYLDAGGKVILSGMNFLDHLNADFAATFLGFGNPLLNSSADFLGTTGFHGFPRLPLDTAKIDIPAYRNKLPNVMVLDTTDHSSTIYRYISESGNPNYHLQPTGILAASTSDSTQLAGITLGFPLYFMNRDSARAFINKAIDDLNIVGLEPTTTPSPLTFELLKNYPNPFNPVTNIRFSLDKKMDIKLVVYNILGQRIRTLYHGNLEAGFHKLQWNGRNDQNTLVGSGIYLVQLRGNREQKIMKVVLIK